MPEKKIVIIGPAYPYRGGNSLFISYVYDILKDKFNISLVNYKLLYPKLLFPGTTQNDVSGKIIKKAPNTRLINSINPFSWFKTANFIKKQNADLVVFDWWNPFFGPSHYMISALIKNHYKGKILFITENVISHEDRTIDKILTKMGIKNADKFLVLSGNVAEQLQNFNNTKPVYKSALPIYDCYDMDSNEDLKETRETLGFTDSDDILLFFGYVRKYKGLNILIDAMPEIVKNNPNAKLLIVGEFYDSPDKYYSQIEKLRLKDKIKVVNEFVPNEEVGKYYSISELVILPYLSATQSGILNIAYGFKKPVLVTDVGGLAEDVEIGKTGYVAPPGKPGAIAEQVNKFLDTKDSIDYKANIEKKLAGHEFNRLPELFDEILQNDFEEAGK